MSHHQPLIGHQHPLAAHQQPRSAGGQLGAADGKSYALLLLVRTLIVKVIPKKVFMLRNKVPTSQEGKEEAEEQEGRGMSSNAAHIFIISPESVTIRQEGYYTFMVV